MPTLRCTRKLLTEVGLKRAPEYADHPDDWHANLVWVDRKKILLFCSTETLYCCLTPACSRADIRNLQSLFLPALAAAMDADGFSRTTIEYCLAKHSEMDIGATNNRSVLGSMTDYAFHLKHYVFSDGGLHNYDPGEIARRLNYIPQVQRHFFNAKEAFQRRLIHGVA